ncbi:hypothetical protein RHGRI_009425 [Rhododendron griersonianum]|uniref:Uncharacterized protein n=1 Tax=Rhododendron griersonianum TaxID=479676 RepID=A0AAV6KEQ4_9ERIC|nr:hypothetical protein RHGRI_009425 [Rhododendron griersonianum]
MDQFQYHNQSLTHSITSLFLNRATQLLLSVSVFSFFFHSKFHFSTFSLQFLSLTMDKNCIFLIFNGLLMLLAKTSGFISLSSPASDSNPGLSKRTGDTGNGWIEKDVSFEKPGQTEEYPMEGESEDSNLVFEDKEEEAPNGLLNSTLGVIPVIEHQECEKELDSIGFFIKEEEAEAEAGFFIKEEEAEAEAAAAAAAAEEEEEEELSTDELNKKFDEFIRRTKEGIRIEAQQQQLVMAH